MRRLTCLLALLIFPIAADANDHWLQLEGGEGPAQGKSVVLISGDEEYRSEEALPMLAKILAEHHGFNATVLFAIDPETGQIDPTYLKNIPGLESLQNADLMIIATRFRDLPDEQMALVDAYLKAGKPVIGLRTATHAFNLSGGNWVHYSNGYNGPHKEWEGGFGRLVLGEKWISHHGHHKVEATRGRLTPAGEQSPILRGIKDGEIFGNSDVYGVRLPLPGDSEPLVVGEVLSTMEQDSAPVEGAKNDPMMPIAWTKSYQLPGGKPGEAFTTTMGAATDLANPALRRLIVNAAYSLVGLEDAIPEAGTNVDLVDDYTPTMYGFGEFQKGKVPNDFAGSKKKTRPLESNNGDTTTFTIPERAHVSIIGNTLADRMQQEGWFESLLQSRFPNHQLVIRNLAFSADELTIRQRSDGFGSPDEWLAKNSTDVLFAFFGFNESFQGAEGLGAFEKNLVQFLDETKQKKFNGKHAPTIILVSPIAAEHLASNPNVPQASELNAQIAPYVDRMREVAQQHGVRFVDIFASSRSAFETADAPLTINGIHLNASGNQQIAHLIDQQLFPKGDALDLQAPQFQDLRHSVKQKNAFWYQRYRTTDGYSIYGGRSHLKFVGGQTNRVVMQREMEILDALTANWDRTIWSVVSNGKVQREQVPVPEEIPVTTNFPGKGPNGTHLFQSGTESIDSMDVGNGLQVQLFASEEEYPELINPVQMAWDLKGRLFVAAWQTYPHWKPDAKLPSDKILILEDTDDDGRADSCKTFAENLHNPTGFEFWNGGVLVANAPELLFLKDTDGDDVADERIVMLNGLDTADTHHTANSFVLGPDGGLYFQEGVFHRTQVETPRGPVRNRDACVWRFDPRSFELQRYAPYGFANPHGHSFDRWGNDMIHDGTGANPYQASLISGFLPNFDKHGRAPMVYEPRTRPCPGTEVLESRHFPEEFQGDLLVGNVIGFQGILRYQLKYDGSALVAEETDPILSSSDLNFRPVDFEIGPDGALYFTDWQNPVIGHMQHNLRDPNRDQKHGRVYRVTHESGELLFEPNLTELSTADLVQQLDAPELRTRYRARIALSAHETAKVQSAIADWLKQLDTASEQFPHQQVEALWVLQGHHAIDRELLQAVLKSPEPLARAAGLRVLSFVLDDHPAALDWCRTAAGDDDPRVRREAVRAASFFRNAEAMEILAIAETQPLDTGLDYLIAESRRVLSPYWDDALKSGREIALTTPAGRRYFYRQLPLGELLELDSNSDIDGELLLRASVPDEQRLNAASRLATTQETSVAAITINAIVEASNQLQGSGNLGVVTDLVRLLAARPSAELEAHRQELKDLALSASQPIVRQVAFAAIVEIDDNSQAAQELASTSNTALEDLLQAIPLIANPKLRSDQFDFIQNVLDTKPSDDQQPQPPVARFVKIQLPEPGTLTLAEVEVFSGGNNVARDGKASQSTTSNGGKAGRAIDGNTSGEWGNGGQTHSREGEDQPWWLVDLQDNYAIEQINIFNRTDGELGNRLDGFILSLLDENEELIWTQADNPAPETSATIDVGTIDPRIAIRRAAMNALVTLRGHEKDGASRLVALAELAGDRDNAINALRRIPKQYWPIEQMDPLLAELMQELRDMPAAVRNSPSALAKREFAESMASRLPLDRATSIREELRELGVPILRIGTLPERMAYDKDILAVAAGKPFELIFENPDLMPHNLVILKPGTLEQVGVLAESTAQDPKSAEREYIPQSDNVLVASHLLASRDSQQIAITAPTEPGVYPYVCTYPGHWRRMFGALYVVNDLDSYLADPEAYLAANELPIRDDLLKDRRPRTTWTEEDLLPTLAESLTGRSFANGQQMFKVANCIACHKLNGEGQVLGPDLATLADDRRDPAEILKSLLDPPARIEEKYRTNVFVTDEGRVITGMVLEERDDKIKVIENPLAKTEPIALDPTTIIEREASPLSIMPKGLLDTLSREEILDLIAYVQTGGNKTAEIFNSAEGHAGHNHDHASSQKDEHAHHQPAAE